jgi:SAM-dependent methyltransferase
MNQERWIPPEIPLDKPNAARIYDYLLGGYHNFAADRAVAEQLVVLLPDLFLASQAHRAFLRRAVGYLVAQGIDQFLDIGSGIPTMGNVHEVAQAANPEARVVYVDMEPVAVAHSQTMLAGNARAVAIRGDVREPEGILAHDQVRRLLDFERPMALLMMALLHYVPDDDVAYPAVDRLRQALAPGSYMAVVHPTPAGPISTPDKVERGVEILRSTSETGARTREQILRFFGEWVPVEPGLVLTPLWRPEGPDDLFVDEPERCFALAGIAYKPIDGG